MNTCVLPTPIRIASSSSLRPRDDMGMLTIQSPLCGDEAARRDARTNGVLRMDFTRAWSAKIPGRSQNSCFGGRLLIIVIMIITII